jgi:hypothetical protein
VDHVVAEVVGLVVGVDQVVVFQEAAPVDGQGQVEVGSVDLVEAVVVIQALEEMVLAEDQVEQTPVANKWWNYVHKSTLLYLASFYRRTDRFCELSLANISSRSRRKRAKRQLLESAEDWVT